MILAPAAPAAEARGGIPLWWLSAGTFAIGIDAFVVAGLLNDISQDLSVPSALGGQLITIFAVGYAVFAPLSAWALARLSRRRTLQIALAVFTLANLVSVLSPSFGVLAASRVFAALGAASYTPQAIAAASEIAPPAYKGRALAIVYGGMTVATALGVPLGAVIGHAIGWRATFAVIAGLGTLTLAGLSLVLPALTAPGAHRLVERLAGVTKPAVLLTLSITFVAALSEHTTYSYISVVLAGAHWPGGLLVLPAALACLGVGAVIGNAISGYATDRFGGRIVLLVALALQSVALLAISFVSQRAVALCVAMAVWGAVGWMYLVPIQHRLLSLSKTYGPLVASLNSSVLYLGIGGGGGVGGLLLTAVAPDRLGVFSAAIGVAAFVFALLFYRKES